MIGRVLAHYRVTELLGQGGMGEVYRALDEKLGREVALKLLPAEVASDPDRLARFRREAQALAALNHSGIGAIYDLVEDQGATFLVLELVEGEDLAARLMRGRLPIDQALEVAVRLATALEVAHERGIVHRDLKPSNVKLVDRVHPKILDFGLAKAQAETHESGVGDSASPTLAADATEAGAILGTAAYMAPEQAQGQAVDKRADIWAFGVVLYEMLTGDRLFVGSSYSATLVAVLSQTPDWSRLPAATPLRVRRVLARCLRREPLERLRDIGEARVRLQAGTEAEESTGSAPAGLGARPRLVLTLASLLALLGLAAGRWLGPPPPASPERPSLQLDLELEGLGGVDRMNPPKISPEGRRILYAGPDGLRIRPLTELETLSLAATDHAFYPFWSPDGHHIAYLKDGRLWRTPATGGAATELGPVPDGLMGGSAGGAWDHRGRLVLAGAPEEGLVGFTADGRSLGELLSAAEDEADFHEIEPLPGGSGFLFSVHGLDGIDTIAAWTDGQRKEILRLPGETLAYPSYSPTGHLLYERRTTNPGLWAARFSLDSLEVVGPPFLVIPRASQPSLSQDGTLVFVRPDPAPAELVQVGLDGLVRSFAHLSAPLGPDAGGGQFGLSPDGRRIALPLNAHPYADLWVVGLERGTRSRLDEGWVGWVRPVWMPDSSRLLYASQRDSPSFWTTWLGVADGTRPPELLRFAEDLVTTMPLAVSPDGEWLVFAGAPSEQRIAAIRFDDPSDRRAIAGSIGPAQGPTAAFSPDGRWLAYPTRETGIPSVWVQPFPPDGRRWPVSTEAGLHPRWSATGDEIFYRSETGVMVAQFEGGPTPTVSRPSELFRLAEDSGLSEMFEPMPDGEGFWMIRARNRHRVTVVFDLPSLIAEAGAHALPD